MKMISNYRTSFKYVRRCFSSQQQIVDESFSSLSISPLLSSSTEDSTTATTTRLIPSRESSTIHSNQILCNEISKYQIGVPIEQAYSLPNTWYWNDTIHQLEKDAIFLEGNHGSNHGSSDSRSSNTNFNEKWIAVDVFDPQSEPGYYKTGIFAGQPYLLSKNRNGTVNAFYNLCTHMGSCLVGPWTTNTTNNKEEVLVQRKACTKLDSSIVGQPTEGFLFREDNNKNSSSQQQKRGVFQCPYHGWQFNIDGNLIKAPNVKGIQNFRPKDFNLRSIPMKQVGPIVFLNFSAISNQNDTTYNDDNDNDNDTNSIFNQSTESLLEQLDKNGFTDPQDDFTNLQFIQTNTFHVNCNWKVFCDNYGDGCYHCSYAHGDLVSNIDESNYTTTIVTKNLSIQQVPTTIVSDKRYGTTKTALFAQWYPNLMINRYGPWLDIDIVVPVSATTSQIIKAWFLEKDFTLSDTMSLSNYIQSSIQSSLKVHDEDVFLCENLQIGVQSNGFHQGRYVPTKQIATYHFHQRVASDIHQYMNI